MPRTKIDIESFFSLKVLVVLSKDYQGSLSRRLDTPLTGGDFWKGAVTGATIGYLNHAVHQAVAGEGEKTTTQNIQKKKSAENLLKKLWWHRMFGERSDFVIDASTLDFSNTSQQDLGLIGMIKGETRGVNLFDAEIFDSKQLAFGKLSMTYEGNNQFSIKSNYFDFDYQSNGSFTRNAGTFLGGAIFGRLYETPITPGAIIREYTNIGGEFNIIFEGNVTINPE